MAQILQILLDGHVAVEIRDGQGRQGGVSVICVLEAVVQAGDGCDEGRAVADRIGTLLRKGGTAELDEDESAALHGFLRQGGVKGLTNADDDAALRKLALAMDGRAGGVSIVVRDLADDEMAVEIAAGIAMSVLIDTQPAGVSAGEIKALLSRGLREAKGREALVALVADAAAAVAAVRAAMRPGTPAGMIYDRAAADMFDAIDGDGEPSRGLRKVALGLLPRPRIIAASGG